MIGPSTAGSGSSATLSSTFTSPKASIQQHFMAERCLFCNRDSDDFDSSLTHMQTAHGLFIPDRQRLIVDLNVLVEYLHLVIFGHNECIWCGTQRNTTQAAQQHMIGKSHCRFDISDKASEFADFYDFYDFSDPESNGDDSGEDEDAAETEDDAQTKATAGSQGPIQLDEKSLWLPSGKIISKSSSSQQHQRRQQEAPLRRSASPGQLGSGAAADSGEEGSGASSRSTALVPGDVGVKRQFAITKGEKRAQAFTTQLARLSANDQRSLAHLPTSQQRAVLATQQKQVEKARRAERRYQTRVEGLGNKTLMGHYRPDGPARQNG
jgi:pre-60S factor REI1